MADIRTFVAVDISDSIRAAAGRVTSRLAGHCNEYKWVETENLHVTVNFLGDVAETQVPTVCQTITRAISGFESFSMHLSGVGCFPYTEKPRVVWLGVEDGARELIQLNDRIADSLEELRFPRERKDYVPHLTLGRLQRGGRWNNAFMDAVTRHASFDAGTCIVNEVVIYSSYLDRTGPSYTPMSRVALN